ncbi:MAG: hypothetical protein PWP23_3103 [Candidatus Sumerlaeota bacterium]|nr:hypothetical protein [Candidatus Sumerlaeota bacterium]
MSRMKRWTWSTITAAAIAAAMPGAGESCWGSTSPDDCIVAKTSATLAGKSHNERVEALARAVVSRAGAKSAEGLALSSFPAGTRLDHLEYAQTDKAGNAEHVIFYVEFPESFHANGECTSYRLSQMGNEFIHALQEEGISGYFLRVHDPKSGEWLAPDEIAPLEEVSTYTPEIDEATVAMAKELGKNAFRELSADKRAPFINPGQPQGSLSGRTVFLNQSHGWFDDYAGSLARWRVQRGNAFGTLEDFDSAEFLNIYVLPMLRNAGAKVMTVREPDLQTNMVIVDNSDTAAGLSNGRYVETGSWANSSLAGFVHKTGASWNGVTINPFDQGSGQNRLSSGLTTGTPTATATWTANIPADGFYNVYASWTPFSGRAQDAQYLVHHSGGVSEVRVDQTIDGYTWFLLGNWYFEADAPENERQVVLTNNSNDTDAVNVSADAVRWGGGMGDFARHANGVSGRPRWEEEAVINLQFYGMGLSGLHYTGDDDEEGGWADRPQYAKWEHSIKDGSVEDAVYIAWHTNAFNGEARGLSSFRHSSATAESENLQTIMHDKLYNAINTQWFTGETWTVRSKNVTNFGENNQNNLGTNLPGMLLEGLFHDNEEDSTAYNEPEFRLMLARAFTHGIIDYFNDRDGTSLPYPPETPVNFRVESLGNGQVQLSWSPGPSGGFYGAAPTSYRVYRSKNGFGFDDGTVVSGTTTTLTGLPTAGQAEYFRVAAVNAGGQSFPTETLAASDGSGDVLIVNAFDRNQRSQIPTETITNAGTDLRRHDPRNFQAFNYIIEHAEAIAPSGLRISSTSNEPVANGTISLGDYALVVWIGGEEATNDDAVSAAEQTRLSTYLNANGKLFISGAEIGWDLGRSGVSSGTDVAFYNNALRTAYVADDAGTYNVTGTAGGPFASVGTFSFAPTSGARYDAEYPDVIATSGGSQVALTYSGGSGGTAGVSYSGTSKVISLGFPFETIATAANRRTVMEAALAFFDVASPASVNWEVY